MCAWYLVIWGTANALLAKVEAREEERRREYEAAEPE